MKKTYKIIYMVVMMIVLLIFLGILYLNTQKIKGFGLSLEYMNSDEISDSIKSPRNIHVVLAKYKGNIKPKTISKFSYNFAYNVIPNYVKLIKQGKMKVDDENFYSFNKKTILEQTGIDNYKEYNQFIKKISALNKDLEIESYTIPIDSITIVNNGLEAHLNIKYKENEEITFYLKIENSSNEEITGIKVL